MYFTEQSQNLMKPFLDNFDITTRSIPKQKIFDKICRILYRKITSANIYIRPTKKVVSTELEPNSLYKSYYVPKKIQKYIPENFSKIIKYKTLVKQREVEIIFVLFNTYHDCDKYIKKILLWLCMIPPTNCSNSLNITICFTPFKKNLPSNRAMILSPEHCNSAVTTSCTKNGKILIFREEEWFKCLIHECFHVMGLDFSEMNCIELNRKMHELYPISSQFNLFEAYSEFWATILNCVVCSYQLLDNKKDMAEFLLYMDFCIQLEQMFSFFQMKKVLNFMGIKYSDLHMKTSRGRNARSYLYREKTNVFSYYIMKTLLISNVEDFMNWCLINNVSLFMFKKNEANQMKFYNFIKKIHQSMEIPQYEIEDKKLTLRMSICEN